MLILLDKNKVKVAALTQLKDYSIKEKINIQEALTFSLSLSDDNNKLIEEECYIETEEQRYIIKSIKKQATLIRYECKQDLEELKSKLHLNGFNSVTLTVGETIRLAIAGTGWSVEDTEAPTRKRSLKLDATNSFEIIQKAIKKFNCEVRFNTKDKKVMVKEKFGSNKGVYFSEQLNLKALNTTSDTLDFATRMYVRGKDGLTFSDINNNKEYVEDFSYSNKIINILWSDSRYTDKESMLEDAKLRIKDICKPKKSYDVDILDLASIYKEYNSLSYGLGDEITLLSGKDKFSDKQRIVELIKYPLDPEKNNAIIANTQLSFEDLQKQAEETQDVVDGFVNENGTINGSKIEDLPITEIEDGSITTKKIAANAITTEKLNAGAITAEKIDAGAINAGHISAGTITANSAIIDDAAITNAKIANGAITKAKIEDAAIDSAKIDKLAVNSAHIQDGAIGTAQIEDAAITNAKIGKLAVGEVNIANAAITNAKIGNLAVDSAKIKDAAITNAKIGSLAVDSAKIADAAIINAKIANLAVDNAKIASLDAGKINAGDILADRMKANAITAINADIGTATINAAKIGALDAGKITTGDLSADRMKTNAITAINAYIGAATIDSAKIGNLDAGKITAGDIAAERIQAQVISAINTYTGTAKIKQAQIDALTVGSANITDASITSAKITDLAVTNAKIANATIESAKIKSLDVSKLNAGTIDTTKFTIASTNGKLSIANNTITIKDAQATPQTRVQIGLDAKGNYGVYVLNAAGVPIFDSDKGVLSADGLNNDVVTTDKILDGAVSPSKIQIEELWADEAFIGKLSVASIDASQIKTGKISNEVIDLAGLVTFEAFAPDIKPMFSVTGDKTYINGGMIATNTIQANSIDLLSGFTVKGPDNQNSFAIASNGEIEINGWLHSTNYVPGVSGYSINRDGTAELNEVKVRGTFDALDAGITNVNGASDAIRIWAGGTYENRAAAKFRVNKNGDLFATNATLSGVLYGDLVNDNLTIDNGSVLIKNGAATVVNINSGQTILNTDVEIGNNNVRYSKGDNLLNLNDTDFRVNSAQGTVLVDKSSGVLGGLNIIGPSGGHHILRGSTATNRLGTLVFDSQGNQGETGDFSFTRKGYTEKCKVNIDGDLTIADRISSTVYPIEQRWANTGTYEGLGFYVM